MSVSGILRAGSASVAGQRILFFGPGPTLVEACDCDPEGRFECDVSAEGSVDVLAKIKTQVVAVLHEAIELPREDPIELAVDDSRLFDLEGTIESDAGFPEHLNVFLNPVALEGVPERLGDFVNQRDEGVFDARFYERPVSGSSFAFRVAAGRWRIGGDYLIQERPMTMEPDYRNYTVERAVAEGVGELPGSRYSGFELEVSADVRVSLSLRVVEDAELAG